MVADTSADERYLETIRSALAVCRLYKPKFGKGRAAGLSVEEFRELYQRDAFYCWFGLDSPLVYAAHKAAGGMTSLYRQIGISCERVFRQVIQDTLDLDAEQAIWSYQVPAPSGKKPRTLTLDGRIPLADVADAGKRATVTQWLADASRACNVDPTIASALKGPVFEVRQGYKSKDSKRQNADVANAANAYAASYLPVVGLLSIQIDGDIAERYSRAQWLILRGTTTGTPLDSIYVFSREILGYDLAGFFERNSETIKADVEGIIEALLR